MLRDRGLYPGYDFEKDAAAVKAGGGRVAGSVRVPINALDYSSFLLQAQGSGANVVAFATAGADTATSIKQAAEFGTGPTTATGKRWPSLPHCVAP